MNRNNSVNALCSATDQPPPPPKHPHKYWGVPALELG